MAYATLDELKGRLDWALDDDEERIATNSLVDASALAAHYGREWPDAQVPQVVKTVVLKACKRYMDNPSGYVTSRAGDETVGWSNAQGADAGTVFFTADEQELIAAAAGKSRYGLYSACVVAYGTDLRQRGRYAAGMVPIEPAPGKDFPLYSHREDPW
jgi:hypothetical protein